MGIFIRDSAHLCLSLVSMLLYIVLKNVHGSQDCCGGILARTLNSESTRPGSNPLEDILDFFAVFPNFKGKFPVCANFREHGTLSMLIYMLQRVARAKSHSRAILCSVYQFSKEKCNY